MADDAGSIRLIVEEAGGRIDRYVAAHVPSLSRSRIEQLLADGHILLNNRIPKKSEAPIVGDVIEVTMPNATPSSVDAEDIPLTIVYEDGDIAVIDKPSGLVVHPAPGHRGGTLVNALLHHLKDLSGIGGVMRPGIVHRLDKDTSGLLLIAKNDDAHRELSAALKRRDIKRIYQVAAWGHLRQETITVDAPIARSHNERQRMAVLEGGRRAVTHFRRMSIWPAAELLRAELDTGRTHQIRVHLAHIGHPVVGDSVYGIDAARGMSGPALSWARSLARQVPRQFLHAAELSLEHPVTGIPLRFTSQLPPDLAAPAAWAEKGLDVG
ncbi:MAG: RluA family pseudouridine synthase [Longimicrobiales bacterium]